MKVFFDIITNHTADVIDYRVGVRRHQAVPSKPRPRPTRTPTAPPSTTATTSTRPSRRWTRTSPSRTRRSSAARPTPTRQDPGLAQRPDDVPQPRRLDLRRRDLEYGDFPRAGRPGRPVHRAPRGRRGDGRHLQDVGRRPASTASGSTPSSTSTSSSGRSSARPCGHAATVENDDFFMFGEVYDGNPRVHVPVHDRGQAAGHPRLRLPGQGVTSPRASRRPCCATSSR